MLRQALTITALSLSLLITAPLSAKPTNECHSAEYSAVMPALKDFRYGIDRQAARRLLEQAFPGKGIILNRDMSVDLNIYRHHQDVFDIVSIAFAADMAVSITFSYSNSLQTKLGGGAQAVVTVLEKLKAKIGNFDSNDINGETAKLIWGPKKGLTFSLIGRDPDVLLLRFACETVKAQARKALSGSIGF